MDRLTVSLRKFVAELKRRRVIRVGAVYAVVAWLVIQVAETTFPYLNLPDWTITFVVVLVLLGLPIALGLAWAFDVTPDGVVRTGPAEGVAAGGPAPSPRRARVLVLTSSAVVLLAGGGGLLLLRGGDAGPRGPALLSALDDLIADERYVEAFELARPGRARGDVPDSVWLQIADHLTVASDPSGARVLALRIEEDADVASGAWRDLGATPLHGLPVARGEYLLRLELEGHAGVERIASSALTRARNIRAGYGGEVVLSVPLIPDSLVHGREVVYVPGGMYAIVSRDLQGHSALLEDYFLDRFEVSNDDFAAFVDAGGYRAAAYWSDLDRSLGADAGEARRMFVDRTGLPGPRGWSGQRVLAGQGNLPVVEVTWFEAAAYCRSRGARLPTIYEWEKGARNGQIAHGEGVFMPWGFLGPRGMGAARANFSSDGPAPVDAFPFGISPYGAYGMAGNAKEWLSNPTETGRAVTGGSWADPMYVFSEVGSLDPMSHAPTLGFRCARHADATRTARSDQGGGPVRVAIRTPEYEPVGDDAFPLLLAHYAYDLRPSNAEVVDRVEGPGWTRERILFDGVGETRVIAYLYLPHSGRGPFQTMVFVPSAASFFGTRVTDSAEWLLAPLIRAGRALFVVVMEGMTEREWPAGFAPPAPNSVGFRDQMVRHATELRLGLDYLETRGEIDMSSVAYIGLSWGAGSRLLFAALDDRFRAVAFIGGGIDERMQPTLPEASNINFAPRIQAPKLLLNGLQDEEHPWLTRALPLWNLLAEPKELVLVDEAGHVPPLESRVPALRDWMDRVLGRPGGV
jgi:eukaryotic-like serine/threonine-protein kinase